MNFENEYKSYISLPRYSKEFFYSKSKNLEIRIKTHLLYSESKIKWDDWVLSSFTNKKINNVLDLGCGNGRFIFSMIEKKIGKIYTGIDISKEQIEDAIKHAEILNYGKVLFKEADVTKLKTGNDKYDLILCNHMLWHIKDVNNFLKKISGLISKSGCLLATVNSKKYMSEMYDAHTNFCKIVNMPSVLRKKIRISGFNLENGYDILSKYFCNVKKYILKDKLIFKKPGHFLNYYKTYLQPTSLVHTDVPIEKWKLVFKMMKKYVENEIDSKGQYSISKNSGYFIASN